MSKKLGVFIVVAVLFVTTLGASMASAAGQRTAAAPKPNTDAAGRPLGSAAPAPTPVASPPTQSLVQGVLPAKASGDDVSTATS